MNAMTRNYLPAQMKASDSDRDAVVSDLGEHFQAGRLTAGEFDERMGRALAARTWGELRDRGHRAGQRGHHRVGRPVAPHPGTAGRAARDRPRQRTQPPRVAELKARSRLRVLDDPEESLRLSRMIGTFLLQG